MRPQIAANTEKEMEEYKEALKGLEPIQLEDEFDHQSGKADNLMNLIGEALSRDSDPEDLAGPIVTAVDEAREALDKLDAIAEEIFNRLNEKNRKEAEGGNEN